MKRQYLVIGLGRFGTSLSTYLHSLGAEVMAVDKKEALVNEIADSVTYSLIADTTDEKVVKDMGVDQFDNVICAIGGDVEASLMTTLLMREFGAKHLTSKASTGLHGRLLEKIGADRVVYPERDMAYKLARDFQATPGIEELMTFTVNQKMFEFKAPAAFDKHTLKELHLRHSFGINVVAVRRGETILTSPGANELIFEGDGMLVVGEIEKTLHALENLKKSGK